MKKSIILFLTAALIVFSYPVTAYAVGYDDIISEAAVLMDAETGQILFNKDMDKIMFPASTTKIMSALLAAENLDMKKTAEVTSTAVDIDVWDSSSIGLMPGEKLTVDSLMYGMMLPSANDAANVLAEEVAGSEQEFASLMNERARLLGACNTHFTNAHGLHDPSHYTTARDLAIITREAVKNPVLMKYFGFGAVNYILPETNLSESPRYLVNYQYMQLDTSYYYDSDVIGGKVGYTLEAKHTMSAVSVRNGRMLICVVLSSPNRGDKFADTKKLFDFGFNEFEKVTVLKTKFSGFSTQIIDSGNEAGTVDFYSLNDFTALLHNSLDPSKIKIKYSHEYPFNIGEDIASSVSFYIDTDNPVIPDDLGSAELKMNKSMLETDKDEEPSFNSAVDTALNSKLFIPLSALVIAVLVSASLFIARLAKFYMRRGRRRRRLTRLQRKQEKLYVDPVPVISGKTGVVSRYTSSR